VYISSQGGTTKNGYSKDFDSFFADFVVAIINKLLMRLQIFNARSQNCEKLLLASSCLSVHPPDRKEKLGFHYTDFHKILYLRIRRKSAKQIQASLQYDTP
jgi:hypothetical protein